MIETNLTQSPNDAILRGVPGEFFWSLVDNREGRRKWRLIYPGYEEGRLPEVVVLSEPFITHPGGMLVYLVLRYDPGLKMPKNLLEHRNFEQAQSRAIAEAQKIALALKRAKVKKITAKSGKRGRNGSEHARNRPGRAYRVPKRASGSPSTSEGRKTSPEPS